MAEGSKMVDEKKVVDDLIRSFFPSFKNDETKQQVTKIIGYLLMGNEYQAGYWRDKLDRRVSFLRSMVDLSKNNDHTVPEDVEVTFEEAVEMRTILKQIMSNK